MQSISNAMTFADPLIWAMYKFEAYADETQPIRTMQDFRLHCSKPGYICTKRFIFVNETLSNRSLSNLADTSAYPDQKSLTESFNTLWTLSQDSDFIRVWKVYEYHRVDSKAAKWENYTHSNARPIYH